MARKHYVVFHSPGTFFHETSQRPIEAWDAKLAVKMDVVERYESKPFGFYFITTLAADPVSDGEGGTLEVNEKEVARSPMHFINGKVWTCDELEMRDDESLRILISNMRCNHWPLMVETNSPWKSFNKFDENDVVVDSTGEVIIKGNAKRFQHYRKKFLQAVA